MNKPSRQRDPSGDNGDYTSKAGAAAIGARLRRLSERIDREAHELHSAFGVPDFEQRWFGVLNQLDLSGPLSVGDLAERLGISHVSVSQSRASMERSGLIDLAQDPNDGRRRHLRLTRAGKDLVRRLRPLWNAMSAAAVELDEDAGGILEPLRRLEVALEKQSLLVRTQLKLGEVASDAAARKTTGGMSPVGRRRAASRRA